MFLDLNVLKEARHQFPRFAEPLRKKGVAMNFDQDSIIV